MRSGLKFSFRPLEVPEPRVRKSPLSLNSGKYGLRNHLLPMKSSFLMRKSEKKGLNSKSPRCPIFKFFVVTREFICQKMSPILDPVYFFGVFSLISHCDKPVVDAFLNNSTKNQQVLDLLKPKSQQSFLSNRNQFFVSTLFSKKNIC